MTGRQHEHAPDDGLYARALALYERGDPAAAALLAAVLAADPDNVTVRYQRANLHQESGDLEEAMAGYQEVLRRAPAHAEALNNLGAVQQMRQNPIAAEACYRQAIACSPGLATPAVNLARLLQERGRGAEAAGVCADAEARGLDAGVFGHLRAAAMASVAVGAQKNAAAGEPGDASGRAPDAYVRATFDAFAAAFEQRLVDELDYRVPAALVELVRPALTARGSGVALEVLDLGCGTGLVGVALGPLAASLVGVDLSARMLDEARKKGCYAELHEADISGWLAGAPQARFDLIVAADVFIYIGALDAVFSAAARTLRASGLFAFSIETCSDAHWLLLPSGRYAQSEDYIAGLVSRNGLIQCSRQAAEIRRGVPGTLYLVGKP